MMSILVFCLWLKLYLFLTLTQNFGIIIKIIELMIKDLLNFFIVLMITLFAFASLIHFLLETKISDYSNLWYTVRTLIFATLGSFGSTTLTDKTAQILNSLFLIVFLFISSMIMINLLIAILSNTYSKVIDKSQMEHSLILYDYYVKMKFDKLIGSIILFPPPFNIIPIIFSPIIIFFKNYKVNRFLEKLAYIPHFFVCFFIYNIICLIIFNPLAYFKVFIIIN